MAWPDDVADKLRLLPRRFRLEDVYRFVPTFHQRHPENRHIEEKVRQSLQLLRDAGKIKFLPDRGTYENLEVGDELIETLPLQPGDCLDRRRLATLMGIESDAALRRGMFRPAKGPLQNHLFLFHDEKSNPYGDVVEPGRIRYVGQGMKGDQELTSYNRYLAEHFERGLHVHYFTQPRDKPGEIRYDGEVVLENYRPVFRPKEDRSVLEFTLVPVPAVAKSPLNEYGRAYDEILEDEREPGFEDRVRSQTLVARVVRARAFQNQILLYYGRQCAVCGRPYERGPVVDVQAAHIVPVSEGGRDEPRNGIGLCARHHWAFDNAFFTVNDDFSTVWLGEQTDPHGEIQGGRLLTVPKEPWPKPHPLYLRHHRNRSVRIARAG